MSSSPSSKSSAAPKKDTSVAIVIGQQRRTSETQIKINNNEDIIKSNMLIKENGGQGIKNRLEQHLLQASRSNENKKKFLINDILQQKSLQEQSIPASHNPLHLMHLFRRGMKIQ